MIRISFNFEDLINKKRGVCMITNNFLQNLEKYLPIKNEDEK